MMDFEIMSPGKPGGDCLYHITHPSDHPLIFPGDYPLAVISLYPGEWGGDLSPWPAPALRPGEEDFSGGGDAYLMHLEKELLPRIDEALGFTPRRRFLAGYSLSGLFSLYAVTRSPVFSGCACMSGSLWYPGWTEYIHSLDMKKWPEALYFSLGRKEGNTRHPVMRSVNSGMEETAAFFEGKGVHCETVWHPGGHFHQVEDRIRLGIDFFARRS